MIQINKIIITIIILIAVALPSNQKLASYFINRTNDNFNQIKDYTVDMTVKLDIPAFRMPKKKYTVYYKQPNKIKIKSKGFGILPKTGLFTSPNDNFDNLKNIKISNYTDPINIHDIAIAGELIIDSLKLDMPNEYSKLTFKPTVSVIIDTLNWVIKNVTTKLDTLKLFQIKNSYSEVHNNYYMPTTSTIKYYVKDEKIFNWLNKDVGNIIDADGLSSSNNSIVEGTITVSYKNYKINTNLNDKIFE
tara:strand:- start:60 stop:800 length:741 start_codon:yes stop_codon:yes gene_type:complete